MARKPRRKSFDELTKEEQQVILEDRLRRRYKAIAFIQEKLKDDEVSLDALECAAHLLRTSKDINLEVDRMFEPFRTHRSIKKD
jgi:hypothetical protein